MDTHSQRGQVHFELIWLVLIAMCTLTFFVHLHQVAQSEMRELRWELRKKRSP